MSRAILCKQLKSIVVSKIFKLQNSVKENVSSEVSYEKLWDRKVNYASDLYQNFLPVILFYSSHELMEKFIVFL